MPQKGKDYIGVGVGAVIVEHDRILLLKRLKEPEAGCWSIQGGAVEFGETIENAIRREVKEELSVDCEILRLLGVVNHILPEAAVHWVAPVFLVKIIAGIPKNMEPNKHSDLRWFDLTNLPVDTTLTTQCALSFLNDYWSE
ncbi:NUDIX domain-containing protein [Leptolyngbya sp. FACHB-36]|nr:NUDIX domain-containing protein [Leptolyngbya sp. FACHB-36]